MINQRFLITLHFFIGTSLNIYENEKQLYYEQCQRYKDSDVFMLAIHTFVYEGKNIIGRNIFFEK